MNADAEHSAGLSAADAHLVQRLQTGDHEAVVLLERRFADELRLFCRRMLGDAAAADDLVQDVFMTCCRVSPAQLPQRSIRGWLYQIARRRCIDVQRRANPPHPEAARGVRPAQPNFDFAQDPLTTPAGKALKLDRAAAVLRVVQDLDEDLRTVILMRYFQDLPREEIAEAIGLSLAGTKARLSKAMELLRQRLARLEDSGT